MPLTAATAPNTRFGRRLLGRFLATALLPSTAIAVLGIAAYTDRIESDAASEMTRVARQARVLLLSALQDTVSSLSPETAPTIEVARLATVDQGRVTSARLLLLSAAPTPRVVAAPGTEGAEQPVFVVERGNDGSLRVHDIGPAVWRRLRDLFDGEAAQACVFGMLDSVPLICTDAGFAAALRTADWNPRRALADSATGARNATATGHFLATSPVYLRQAYGADDWVVVIGRSRDSVFGPLRSLAIAMTLMVALTGVLAFLLTQRTVREQTQPLVTLSEAARQVGTGRLEDPVIITSADEFALVGAAFEDMRRSLHGQFRFLDALTHVDQAALTATEIEAVASTAVDRLLEVTGASAATLSLFTTHRPGEVTVWHRDAGPTPVVVTRHTVPPEHQRNLRLSGGSRRVGGTDLLLPPTRTVPDLASRLMQWPLRRGAESIGAVTLAFSDTEDIAAARMDAAAQLVDRIALGLISVAYRDDLAQLSRGSIQALARAVDAASQWTSGHSERVTRIAGLLGEQLDLAAADQLLLERGSLLHDIGKVGIPASILDKAGPLTPDEWRLMKEHTVIGERILAPIPTLQDILPLVRSHHERLDGSGYPDGLVGDAIHPLARILAVADVFDALYSARPYRAALSVDDVVRRIRTDSGTHFDPTVVAALEALHDAGVLAPSASATPVPGAPAAHRGLVSSEELVSAP